MKVLKIGFPSGSLKESTFNLFEKAGYRVRLAVRSYVPDIDDPELEGLMFRAQEIAQYVERGVVDVGLTGKDWILENDAQVVEIDELIYSKSTSRPVSWVIAVPEESSVQKVEDLQGKRIATELVGATRRFLEGRGVEAKVEFSWGTTEVKPGIPGPTAIWWTRPPRCGPTGCASSIRCASRPLALSSARRRGRIGGSGKRRKICSCCSRGRCRPRRRWG